MKYKPLNESNRKTIEDCSGFQARLERFFSKTLNQTLELHFYCWGLQSESIHYQNLRDNLNFTSPTIKLYKGKIAIEEIVSVQMGKDLNNEYDETEADKFDTFYWKISRAKQFNRPDWAFFHFYGNIQGALNAGQIDQERFVQYLRHFPVTIIKSYQNIFIELFNHFNEKNLMLDVYESGNGYDFEIKKINKK